MRIIALFLLFLGASFGATITQMLENASQAPLEKIDELALKGERAKEELSYAALYPKLSLVGSIDHYNSPTNLRPLSPTESADIAKSNGGYPFSRDIASYGAVLSMPIFVKSLYTNAELSNKLVSANEDKKRLSASLRQATIIGANAKYEYINDLLLALEAKKASLQEVQKTIEIKVKNGRAAEIELTKINEQLNQVEIKKSELNNSKLEIESLLKTLTGIEIDAPAKMSFVGGAFDGEALALSQKSKESEAAALAQKSAKESLWPTISLNAKYFKNYGKAYNNDESVERDYGSVGVQVVLPLFDKERYSQIELKSVEAQKAAAALAQTKIEIESKLKALSAQYENLKESKKLAKASITNYEEMLKVAKTAYLNERMTQEEYLRYEEALLSSKAAYYGSEADIWANITQRGAIYGVDFKGVVK